MHVYLPVAEVSVNALVVLLLGGGIGFLSGMLGVGGGFLMTPVLILIGIPAPVAVATGANQVAASSLSSVLAHWRRGSVDYKMGLVMMSGGLVGSFLGVRLFDFLSGLGQIDLAISLSYVLFLGVVGSLMLVESLRAILRTRRGSGKRRERHGWGSRLPFKMRFKQSNLYISAIPPFLIGICVGVPSAIMGIGGGLFTVPAMIYLLGMPTSVVVGTSLFQILFVASFTTLAHAIADRSVDALLAVMLILGGVIGAQLGARIEARLKAEQLRILLALLVLAVCLKLGFDLVRTPGELYVVTTASS